MEGPIIPPLLPCIGPIWAWTAAVSVRLKARLPMIVFNLSVCNSLFLSTFIWDIIAQSVVRIVVFMVSYSIRATKLKLHGLIFAFGRIGDYFAWILIERRLTSRAAEVVCLALVGLMTVGFGRRGDLVARDRADQPGLFGGYRLRSRMRCCEGSGSKCCEKRSGQ